MKIALDIRSAVKKSLTGIGRYTVSLINALAAVDRYNKYYLYSKKKPIDFKRRLPELPGPNYFHCVDYFGRGPGKVLPDVDIFHTSSYDLKRPGRAKFIVTVHDVIHKAYPQGHDERTRIEIDQKLRRVLDDADTLVADSYNTKSDLIKFYRVPEARITVIYPGVDTSAMTKSGSISEGRPQVSREKYILFVGTLEPRKNIEGVIKAFTWLKKCSGIAHKLYIAGMKGWGYKDIFRAYEGSEARREIIFKGRVSQEELVSLYIQASVFVYPSFYEGFGFPVLEAFSYGVPVVTSKTSSCGEIAGEAALLVDPANYEEIGDAILKVITDEKTRQELTKKGFDRVKQFTWKKAAEEFIKLWS